MIRFLCGEGLITVIGFSYSLAFSQHMQPMANNSSSFWTHYWWVVLRSRLSKILEI